MNNRLITIPTFEEWVQRESADYKGNDVCITEETPLMAWLFQDGIRLDKLVEPPSELKMAEIPAGDYKVYNHDTRYITLTPVTEDEEDNRTYLVKRYDFEEVKQRIKAE